MASPILYASIFENIQKGLETGLKMAHKQQLMADRQAELRKEAEEEAERKQQVEGYGKTIEDFVTALRTSPPEQQQDVKYQLQSFAAAAKKHGLKSDPDKIVTMLRDFIEPQAKAAAAIMEKRDNEKEDIHMRYLAGMAQRARDGDEDMGQTLKKTLRTPAIMGNVTRALSRLPSDERKIYANIFSGYLGPTEAELAGAKSQAEAEGAALGTVLGKAAGAKGEEGQALAAKDVALARRLAQAEKEGELAAQAGTSGEKVANAEQKRKMELEQQQQAGRERIAKMKQSGSGESGRQMPGDSGGTAATKDHVKLGSNLKQDVDRRIKQETMERGMTPRQESSYRAYASKALTQAIEKGTISRPDQVGALEAAIWRNFAKKTWGEDSD